MTAPVLSGPSATSSGPAPSPHDYDEQVADISDRVRAERRARGWNQQQLAARAHMVLHQVKRLEQGSAPMRSYLAVCDALGIEFSALVAVDWEMPARSVLTPRQAEVIKAVAATQTFLDAALLLGTTREQVGARMSEVYRLLDVTHVPYGRRREAAVEAARRRGILPAPSEVDAA